MIHVPIPVEDAAELLDSHAFGPGALLRWESSPTPAGTFIEGGTLALVDGTSLYNVWDAAGVLGTWYRWRVSDSAATTFGLYSTVVEGGMSRLYCDADDVKLRLASVSLNISSDHDGALTAKCAEVTADINRMVSQARGVSGDWSFIADTLPSPRTFFGPAGGTRLLPIDDCVAVTSVSLATSPGVVLQVLGNGADYLVLPINGALPVTGLLRVNGVWPQMPYGARVNARWGYGTSNPPDAREAAVIEVIRSYLGDQAGNNDTIGMTPYGSIITAKAFTSKLRQLVSDYSMGAGFLRGG